MSNYYFGDWIKEQRESAGLTQKKLAERTGNKITQSTISMWERREIAVPSIQNVLIIVKAFNLTLRSVPFDHFNLSLEKTGNKIVYKGCEKVKERFSLYELTTATSLKTFEGKTYELKGFVGVEQSTGEVKHITDLYYNARTVARESEFLAKRKKENDELMKVKGHKRLQKK